MSICLFKYIKTKPTAIKISAACCRGNFGTKTAPHIPANVSIDTIGNEKIMENIVCFVNN